MVFIDRLGPKGLDVSDDDFMGLDFDADDDDCPQLTGPWGLLSDTHTPSVADNSHQLMAKCEHSDQYSLYADNNNNNNFDKPIITTSNTYTNYHDNNNNTNNYGYNNNDNCDINESNNDPDNPLNIENLMLKIIESNDKQNERMMIQVRLKQVLLDHLKAKQPTPAATPGAPLAAAISPLKVMASVAANTPIPTNMSTAPGADEHGSSKILYNMLTPPISPPSMGHHYFMNHTPQPGSAEVMSMPSSPINAMPLPLITTLANTSQQSSVVDTIDMSDNFYPQEPIDIKHQLLPQMIGNMEDMDGTDHGFMGQYMDNRVVTSSNSSSRKNSAVNRPQNKLPEYSVSSPITSPVPQVPVQTAPVVKKRGKGGRKQAQPTPPETPQQAQKRTAHLSAEFRYRTKLNDKIARLRSIVGPKSQLSKSGVLSRSIDLIAKLQKSNNKLREENRRMRLMLMQACNQGTSQVQSTPVVAAAGNGFYTG